MALAKRVGFVFIGFLILMANNGGGEPNTVFGFSTVGGSEALGYNVAKVAIMALAIWCIYRGWRPVKVQ